MDKISRPNKLPSQNKVANDNEHNGGRDGPRVICDLPQIRDIVPGEVELIARYLGDLLLAPANDNDGSDDGGQDDTNRNEEE